MQIQATIELRSGRSCWFWRCFPHCSYLFIGSVLTGVDEGLHAPSFGEAKQCTLYLEYFHRFASPSDIRQPFPLASHCRNCRASVIPCMTYTALCCSSNQLICGVLQFFLLAPSTAVHSLASMPVHLPDSPNWEHACRPKSTAGNTQTMEKNLIQPYIKKCRISL